MIPSRSALPPSAHSFWLVTKMTMTPSPWLSPAADSIGQPDDMVAQRSIEKGILQ